MIYRNGQLITEIHQNILELLANKKIQREIGKVYKGAQLVWVTIYNAIKSCYGSGTWLSDKDWINDDFWKNN